MKTTCILNRKKYSHFLLMLLSFSVSSNDDFSFTNTGHINVVNDKAIARSISGGYYASKDTYGMRSNAVVAAFSANSQSPFNFPILGFSFLKQMSKYKDRDSVSLYSDNTSLPLRKWEYIDSADYGPTWFTAGNSDFSHLKPGMILETKHDPSWSSYIISVNRNKVLTSGWVNSSSGSLGTPKNGYGIIINPITKIWATNFNIFFPENGRAKKGVIQENAIINNGVKQPNYISGIDTVVLPQSKYGGNAAFLARTADSGYKQQWIYGFLAYGNKVSFVSMDSSVHSPEISFHDSSSANNGLVFDGRNKSNSVLWKNNTTVTAKIDPNGYVSMVGYKTSLITSDAKFSSDYARYIINNSNDINIVLPDSNGILNGFTLKIMKIGSVKSYVIFKSPKGEKINGDIMLRLNGQWHKEAVFFNNEWFIY